MKEKNPYIKNKTVIILHTKLEMVVLERKKVQRVLLIQA